MQLNILWHLLKGENLGIFYLGTFLWWVLGVLFQGKMIAQIANVLMIILVLLPNIFFIEPPNINLWGNCLYLFFFLCIAIFLCVYLSLSQIHTHIPIRLIFFYYSFSLYSEQRPTICLIDICIRIYMYIYIYIIYDIIREIYESDFLRGKTFIL